MSDSNDEPTVELGSWLKRLDLACRAYSRAYRQGLQPRIEDFLDRMAAQDRPCLLLALVDTDLYERKRADKSESPTQEEYLERFPGYEQVILQAFAPEAAASTRAALVSQVPGGAPVPPQVRGLAVEKQLGRGGFGTTWKAWHLGLGCWRVLKILHPAHLSPERLEAFRKEAQTMAGLGKHDNLVQVHGLHPPDGPGGVLVLEMEWIDGGAAIEQAPLRWQKAVRYVANAAAGLRKVHAAGLIHGDVTPFNLLCQHQDGQDDRGVLGDFGLAQHADQVVVGFHPVYTAPEVISGGRCLPPADVFGLAATLYGLLTKAGPNDERWALRQWDDLQRSLALACVPEGVQDVIFAGLQAEPERRPALAEFEDHLRTVHFHPDARRLRAQARRSACKVSLTIRLSRLGEEGPQLLLNHTNKDATEVPGPVEIRTGDRLRIEALADVPGYVTILSIGDGYLDVLLPSNKSPNNRVVVGKPTETVVSASPLEEKQPEGDCSQLALIWTLDPESSTPEDWRRRIAEGRLTTPSRRLKPEEPGEGASTNDGTAVVVTVVQRDPAWAESGDVGPDAR